MAQATTIRTRPAFLLIAVILVGLGVSLLSLLLRGVPSRIVHAQGRVIGRVSGPANPLFGASVRWQGTQTAACTDSDGFFSLPRLPSKARVSASAAGYRITTALADLKPLEISLSPLPVEDNAAYEWIDPTTHSTSHHRCSECHKRIYGEWQRSAHARSAANPRLRDLIEGTDARGNINVSWNLRRDHPHGVTVCNSCHVPTLEAGDPHFDSPAAAQGVAALGVHCDFCHKVVDVDTTNIGLTHGRYGMRLLRPERGQQVIFGPHDDANREDNAFAAVYRRSEYCASCHEGTVFGIKLYGTYSEWLSSPAARRGQQCQDCHMAAAADITNMAPGHGGVRRNSSTLSDHSLAGPAVLRYRDALKVMIHTDSTPQGLLASVTVDAGDVGHAVPTGYIDRHLLLLVDAEDDLGNPAPVVNGPRVPAFVGESVSGQAGELYARVLVDPAGKLPTPFWASVQREVDTRILPDRPATTRITFASSAARVRVRLLHRHFWEPVRAAKGWPDDTTVVLELTQAVSAGYSSTSSGWRLGKAPSGRRSTD